MLLHQSLHTKIMEDVNITEEITNIEAKEDVALNFEDIGEVAVVDVVTVI